jgi:hypothetical protein
MHEGPENQGETPSLTQNMHPQGVPMIAYGRNYEDVILARLFAGKTNGFYADIGGRHPRLDNTTYWLYRLGWRGILLHPDASWRDSVQHARPNDRLMSPLPTNSNPLGQILADTKTAKLDLLCVDTGGDEADILAGNDWQRFRPAVVLVAVTPADNPHPYDTGIEALLAGFGYRRVYFDGRSDFYLENDLPEPENMRLPPNQFDYFEPQAVSALRDDLQTMQAYALAAQSRAIQSGVIQSGIIPSGTPQAPETQGLLTLADNLSHENRRLRQALTEARREVAELQAWLAPMHRLSARVPIWEQRERELYMVHHSSSWKLTRPWRMLGRMLAAGRK